MNGKREYGDYQTPDAFALKICKFLKEKRRIDPSIIIEPTCGIGTFIKNSLIFNAEQIFGIEIHSEYCELCEKNINDSRVHIINSDFFSLNLSDIIKNNQNILAIGNPPWVTTSTLSVFDSINIPQKNNFKGLKGIDALTGASNFDICEYIILKMLYSLRGTNSTIAMLCKTSVARNIFSELKNKKFSFTSCEIFNFNANKIFNINVNACLLVIELSDKNITSDFCSIYSFDNPQQLTGKIYYREGMLCKQSLHTCDNFSGKSCFEWRQGVKHDCSKIMELSFQNGYFINGLSEKLSIESDYIYPLIKSSMFKQPIIDKSDKYVIVTQRSIKESTSHIETDAPKTWEYLKSHKNYFENRKSSIYKDSPDFAMFGIGEYSFQPYKVGISGFYKKPMFSLLSSEGGYPIMTDDTSYFICLPTYDAAYTAMLILNSDKVQKFLCSIAFLDSKRPFTKKVLNQLDFHKILGVLNIEDLTLTEKKLGLKRHFNEEMLANFKQLPEFGQITFPLYAS